jgi:hypothetical protein
VKTPGDPFVGFPSLPLVPARTVEANAAPDAGGTLVPDGAVVDDLGETFTCTADLQEIDTVRRVRFEGRELWLLDRWIWNTGHSFVGDVLVPAP